MSDTNTAIPSTPQNDPRTTGFVRASCTRILLGGLVCGVAMFMWGAVSHMLLGLEEGAIKEIPNEGQVLSALTAKIKEPGFYFFPGVNCPPSASAEQKAEAQKKWNEKYLAGPRGILVYHPDGEQAMSPKQLGLQLGAEIGAALVLAWVLAQALGLRTYFCRVGMVTLLGLLPFFLVSVPYWNWFGFPGVYTLRVAADYMIGLVIGGLLLAAIVKPRPT